VALAERGIMVARLLILGPITDAGYWEIVDGHLVHVGGWDAGAVDELKAAFAVIREASQLKTPELADSIAGRMQEFVDKELTEHVGDVQTVIIA
jgi:hypothetical protein